VPVNADKPNLATAPPASRDRLIGLAGVSPNLVKNMEDKQRIPPRMESMLVDIELERISQVRLYRYNPA